MGGAGGGMEGGGMGGCDMGGGLGGGGGGGTGGAGEEGLSMAPMFKSMVLVSMTALVAIGFKVGIAYKDLQAQDHRIQCSAVTAL